MNKNESVPKRKKLRKEETKKLKCLNHNCWRTRLDKCKSNVLRTLRSPDEPRLQKRDNIYVNQSSRTGKEGKKKAEITP